MGVVDAVYYDRPNSTGQLQAPALEWPQEQLREFVLHSVSKTGGHLSSNLGTVELTIALHYVYDTPHDRIVWDVGHQTYPHKILTGRRERMHTLRQLGGIGGFPRRDESEYDTFGTAHSSTSISAALGKATAAQLKGEDRRAVVNAPEDVIDIDSRLDLLVAEAVLLERRQSSVA